MTESERKVLTRNDQRFFVFEPGDGSRYVGFIDVLNISESKLNHHGGNAAIIYAFGCSEIQYAATFPAPANGFLDFGYYEMYMNPHKGEGRGINQWTLYAGYLTLTHLLGYETSTITTPFDMILDRYNPDWKEKLPEPINRSYYARIPPEITTR